ncbi:MAG: GvpL/GvpF family gas vesicle protein [Vicinamibacteria bacterium]
MTGPLYVYAILERAPRGVRVRGLAREPVRFVRSGKLVVAVGRMESAPAPEIANLERHDRVVRRLAAAARAALPARFGSLAPDRAALDDALRPRARSLARALARVRGREQMTLRFEGIEAPDAGLRAGPGTRHLQRRAGRDPRVLPEVRALLDGLAPMVAAEAVDRAHETGIARVHHLIERGDAPRYRRTVARARAADPALRVSCTGPWVPYGFADGAGA